MSHMYRVGIIGCSPMAIGTAPRAQRDGLAAAPESHVDGYQNVPSTELVAVCDLDPNALERFQTFHGAGPALYTEASTMLQRESLDIVSIVTPDNRHHDVFVTAAEAGVQGILCEKPIATSLADADDMIAVTRRTGAKVVVNHTRRFDPRHQMVKAGIERGAIGSVHQVEGLVGGSRAMLFRLGTHLANTMMYFVPSAPVWVQAAFADTDAAHGPGYHGDGGRNPDLEPAATAIIGFADGSRGLFSTNKTLDGGFQVTVRGASGSVTIGSHGGSWNLRRPDGSHETRPLTGDRPLGPAIVPAIASVVDMIETDGDPLPELLTARTTLAVLLAITQSASRDGIRVRL